MVEQLIGDSDLHAYVDGRLDPVRRAKVEAWLARNPELAERVAAWRAQVEALHALYDPVLAEPTPERLQALKTALGARLEARPALPLLRGRQGAAAPRGWAWRTAAAAVLVLSGGLGGYALRGEVPAPVAPVSTLQSFAEQAAQAHAFYTADTRFAVEMGAEDRGALDAWLSQRLGTAIVGPDLSALGYRLIGGRSLPTTSGPGAQYVYEKQRDGGGTGRYLTLFVATPQVGQDAAFSFVRHGEISLFYWLEEKVAYALIGALERDELMKITEAVYRQLDEHRAAGTEATVAPPAQPPGGVQPVGVKASEM